MQDDAFDHMDDLIREAAESHYPVYEDKAWDKMQVLLDKHLPQKDRRRKPSFLFILFMLIGLVASVVIFYDWKKNNKTGNTVTESIHHAIAMQPTQPVAESNNATTDNLNNTHQKFAPPGDNNFSVNNIVSNNHPGFKSSLPRTFSLAKRKSITLTGAVADEFAATDNLSQPNIATTLNSDDVPAKTGVELLVVNKIADTVSVAGSNERKKISTVETEKTADKNLVKKHAPDDKNKKGFKNKFAVTVSAGPGFSFTALNKLGKVKLDYGAGLSYALGKYFVVRSGFYVSRKIYSANPTDYHPPAGYWTYNANVQRVDADCNVYEIPLGISYGFKPIKNHRWLVAAGLSSFILKTETYYYLYKNMQGQTMYKGWTLNNKNKHYFSVLTVSGGYQYQINPRVSLLAEPYLKVPLQGIGFGKIKLNSGGILLTASVKPFAAKRK